MANGTDGVFLNPANLSHDELAKRESMTIEGNRESGPIAQNMKRLDETINYLDAALAGLIDSVAPILGRPMAEDESVINGENPTLTISPMAETIRRYAVRINELRIQVERATERVEL